MVDVELIDERRRLADVVDEWDALAVELGAPASAPAWAASWCARILPEAEVRAAVAREDGRLVGIAPFVLDGSGGRRDLRLMCAGLLQRLGLLVRPGHHEALAAAVAASVSSGGVPDVVALEGVSASAAWAPLVRGTFRSPTGSHRMAHQAAPVVTLESHDFESWMGARSSNFRSEMRRARKRLAGGGGQVRLVDRTSSDLTDVVAAMGRLHRARWQREGKPGVIDDGVEAVMLDVAHAQPAERFRIWAVERAGEIVSAQLFIAGGGEVVYWNGGWDEEHRDVKPGMLGILAAVEDALARGERRLDLGGGAQPYKLRFADDDEPLEWTVVAPIGRRYLRTRIELLPQQLRHTARRGLHRLPPDAQRRVKRVVRRARGQ